MANDLVLKDNSIPSSEQPMQLPMRRLLSFDENGVPQVIHKQIETTNRAMVDSVNFSALFLPYKGQKVPNPDNPDQLYYEVEPEFEGMTNLEVAATRAAQLAANGDMGALKMLLERVAGKPVEKSMNLTAQTTLSEYLSQLGDRPPQHPHQRPERPGPPDYTDLEQML